MTKNNFLKELENSGADSDIIAYYDELILDRIESGESEESVIASYDIRKIVRALEFESAKKELDVQTNGKKGRGWWIVVLALFSAPVTVPLAISLLAILFSFIVVAFSLVVGAIGGLVMGGIGIVQMIIIGESVQFILFTSGIYLIVLCIVCYVGVWIAKGLVALYRWMLVKFFKVSRRRRVV